MLSFSHAPSILDVQRFHHREHPVVTHFGTENIRTPDDLLTLIVRTDASFATRDIKRSFELCGLELSTNRQATVSPERFAKIVESAYATWGTKIVTALSRHLDYTGRYNLGQPSSHVHFHSADSLASAVIRKACDSIPNNGGSTQPALFISLDDMIHEDVFRASTTKGAFAEIGFSRQFSVSGTELGFVARPGRAPIDEQIQGIRQKLKGLRGDNDKRVPIVLIEDNVRHARTLLWIFDAMKRGGVFEDGKIAGIATCFSVATPNERAELRFEGKEIPLIIGVDYADSRVDVVTPRDHLFDGFVVGDNKGRYGRLPSFMLAEEEIARNFKISPNTAKHFLADVIETNLDFCDRVEKETNVTLPLRSFTPGPAIAKVLNVSIDTPMTDVLERARERHGLQTCHPT